MATVDDPYTRYVLAAALERVAQLDRELDEVRAELKRLLGW